MKKHKCDFINPRFEEEKGETFEIRQCWICGQKRKEPAERNDSTLLPEIENDADIWP